MRDFSFFRRMFGQRQRIQVMHQAAAGSRFAPVNRSFLAELPHSTNRHRDLSAS